jgi:hypothetical protein
MLHPERTQLINALRGHLAEFGIVAAQLSAGPAIEVATETADPQGPQKARLKSPPG